jgi:hypothetical protein
MSAINTKARSSRSCMTASLAWKRRYYLHNSTVTAPVLRNGATPTGFTHPRSTAPPPAVAGRSFSGGGAPAICSHAFPP